MSVTENSPASLLDMDDAEFRRLMDASLRAKDLTFSGALHPQVIDRTYEHLVQMLRSVDGQLAAKKGDHIKRRYELLSAGERKKWYAEQARYAAARSATIRFKTTVEEALVTVRRVRNASRVEQLELLIRRHRAEFPDDVDPSDADLALWSAIYD